MNGGGKNRAAVVMSVRQRLVNISKKIGRDFDRLAQQYAIERLLLRLQQSRHSDLFVLKGAMVFVAWGVDLPRITRDLDLLSFAAPDPDLFREMFREVLDVDVGEDGLEFRKETLKASRIKEEDLYAGVRLHVFVLLGRMRIAIQIDVGTGDSLLPLPTRMTFPSLIGGDSPIMKTYNKELVIAEKLHAMVTLGALNSRLKDYFDIWFLSTTFEFEDDLLRQSIHHTFGRRGTEVPTGKPIGLTAEYLENPARVAQWNAFLRKNTLGGTTPDLGTVGREIWSFLQPVVLQEAGASGRLEWSPDLGWKNLPAS